MTLKTKAFQGIFWNAIDKLVAQLGYFAVTIYLAKLIGPEAFGLIGMLTIFMLLAESVINNGFSQALVQRSHQITEADTSTVFYINLVWGGGIYLLLFLTAPFIADFYNKPELIIVSRWLFLMIVINSLTVVVRAKLIINVDFRSQALSGLISILVSAPIAIYLALQGYGYWAFVWLLLIKTLILNIGLWVSLRWYPKLIFCKESFGRLFKFGSNLMLAGVIATLVNNLYVVLIGRYFNANSVGYFTQATNSTNFLSQFISSTLQGVTYPILTSVKDERKYLVHIYKKLLSVTMLLSLPALAGFAAISEQFVELFLGAEWLPTVPVIQILCFARIITPISVVNMSILNAIGRSDLFLKVDLSKLPITLVTLFIAIPFGIEGIAWAMLTSSIISFFINAYYPGKIFGFGAVEQLVDGYKIIISTVVMYLCISMINIGDNFLELSIKITVGIFIYVFALWFLNVPIFNEVKNILVRKYLSRSDTNIG